MYTQIINIVTDPLLYLLMWVAPALGVYVAYLVARRLHNKFLTKNFLFRALSPALVAGVLSAIAVAVSGFFVATLGEFSCQIAGGGRGECAIAELIALFYYYPLSIPVGALLFLYSVISFRGKILQVASGPRIKALQTCLVFILPVFFIATYLLYLPKIQEAEDARSMKMEKGAEAEEGEYICYLRSEFGLVIKRSLVIQEGLVTDSIYVQGELDEQETIGSIEGSTFVFKTPWNPHVFNDCFNSNGENFLKKFGIQLAQ